MKRIIENIPIIVYGIILTVTNLIGLVLLIWGPDEYWKISYVFSGVTLPDLYKEDVIKILLVTVLPNAVLIVCFLLGKRISARIKETAVVKENDNRKIYILNAVSLLVFSYIFIKIFTYIDVKDITAWLNVNAFYDLRSVLMSNLHFYDFVLLYSILPMIVGACYCTGHNKKGKILFAIEMILYVVANVYIFQKRPLIMGLIFIAIVIFLKNSKRIKQLKVKKILCIGALACMSLYLIYATGLTLNTVDEKSGDEYLISVEKADLSQLLVKEDELPEPEELIVENVEKDPVEISTEEITEADQEVSTDEVGSTDIQNKDEIMEPLPVRTFELENASLDVSRFVFTQTMACVGMLNRTAFATIVDVVVFPEFHDYYPVDLGLDMIGLGSFTDENLVAAQILYPNAENPGSCPVPFYVALYTQGGIFVAIIGSALVGLAMGFCWGWLIKRLNAYTIAFGSLIVTCVATIAINSGRNALLASDGAVWPLLILGVVFVADSVISKGLIKIKEK